jgi:hypothetical protein
MANPAESEVQNLLPVQAYFNVDGSFNTFIGQNKPFYATPDPQQSGLQITNSTINSSVIGGITPAAGNFTTATVLTQPVGATDVVNLLALQSYAAGISWKQPCVAATLANITLSGLQTIDGKAVVAGDRVLVKDQSTAANNGIYIASASAWSRSEDANTWDELICAISFIEYGTQAGGAWFCTAQDGGTLGVTAVNWAQFTTSATYSAGTGLTLTGQVFSITPVGTAGTYGSASTVPVFTTNASGQVSSVTNTNIAIGATQITSGTIDSARISGSYSGITGVGTLTDLTVTNNIVGSITGNAATATTATNIAGGAAGSVPYQTGAGATGFLAAGTNGQVLTLASGVPSWATPTVGTVTSVSGAGTVNGLTLTGTVTTSGSLTLGGTLDLSSPPAIGGTAANTVRGTTVTATSNFVGTNFDASGSGGGSLRNLGGTACLQWGGGGGVNVTIDGAINMNGANSAIQINPTGTGTVSIAPAGALTVNPTTASTMNNVAIGGTTPLAGTFTDLRFNGTLSLAGTTGTAGYVLTSNGASAPTWQANANGLAITDDTTTNATRYLAFTSATSGSITGANVSSTKLQYNPSTGAFITTNDASISGLTVGKGAGAVATNTAIGASALAANTSGSAIVAIGANAGFSVTGNNNTFVGRSSGYFTTSGTDNTYLGFQSGSNVSTSTGSNNTAVGSNALVSNTTASNNTAIGYSSLYTNTTGTGNVAVGQNSLLSNTTANYNNAFGAASLYSNTTGANNVAMGDASLYANTTGSNNTSIGATALRFNTTASQNTAVGMQASYANTTGVENTSIGYQSLYANTTGYSSVAVGRAALFKSNGIQNTAVGANTMYENTSGTNNSAVGQAALYSNTTGTDNTAIGYFAGFSQTTGQYNTHLGRQAGYSATTGNNNTFVGVGSGYFVSTGAKNVILGGYNGNQSGLDIRTSTNNVVLSDGDGNIPLMCVDVNNAVWRINGKAAGNYAGIIQFSVDCVTKSEIYHNDNDDRLIIQNDSGGVYLASGGTSWVSASDERLKNITGEIQNGLSKVCTLRAAEYTWKADESAKPQVGLIAQDVLAVLPEAVQIPQEGSTNRDGSPVMMGVSYNETIPLLVAAIKELNAKIEAQALEIATLKGQ